MKETAEQIKERRAGIKEEYGKLYNRLENLYFDDDPIGINFDENSDEYDPEVDRILPRLKNCNSETDTLELIYEVFCKMFDFGIADPKERYHHLAKETWKLWVEYKTKTHG